MKIQHFLYLLLVASFLTLMSCKKEMDTFTPYPVTGSLDRGKQVQARISGGVYNAEGQPLTGAKVTVGQDVVYTDDNGIFVLSHAKVYDRIGHLVIEHQGYFTVPKSFQLGNSRDVHINTVLLKREQTGSFEGSAGGEVTDRGLHLVFEPGSIVDQSGNPYDGPVQVYTTVINPDDEYFGMMMPAMLFGERLDGSGVVLETYGMIGVELTSPSNERLQVRDGRTVRTTMPIPDSQLGFAPLEIPMWSLEPHAPFWVEEVIAYREGDSYVADLPHFSFWNCDVPVPTATINFTIVDEDGNGLAMQFVKIEIASTGTIVGFLTTDDSGSVTRLVPANRELKVFIDTPCGFVKIADIGPFAPDSNTDLGDIAYIPDSELMIMNVTGSLRDCDGAVNLSSYALIKYASIDEPWIFPFAVAFSDDEGNFAGSYPACSPQGQVEVTSVDPVNVLQSAPFNTVYDQSVTTTIEVGQLLACDEFDYYIDLTIDGNNVLFLDSIVTTFAGNGLLLIAQAIHSFDIGKFHGVYLVFEGLDGIPIEDWIIDEPYDMGILGSANLHIDDMNQIGAQDNVDSELVITEVDLPNKTLKGHCTGNTYSTFGSVPYEINFKLPIPD